MNTTIDPDDNADRPEGRAAEPSGDDVRPASPPPPPPVDPAQGLGTGEWHDGAAAGGTRWSAPTTSGDVPGPPSSRRPMLVGVAAGAGAVVVLGALAFALWPDQGDDGGADAAVTTSATPTPSESTPAGPTVTVVDRSLPATQVWTPMDVTCAPGDVLSIAMSGSASHDQTASGTVGPTGLLDPYFHQFNVEGFPDANTMTIIGSLDEDPGTFFVVGESATYVCGQDGELYLGVNDRGVQNNSGAFQATITRTTHG